MTKRLLFLLLSVWAPLCLADASCPTTVLVSGDANAEIEEHLHKQQISTQPTEGCHPTKVKLTRTSSGFSLEIKDTQGRVIHRDVSSVAAAAAVIESWARADLSEPLLFRSPPPKKVDVLWYTQREEIPYPLTPDEEPLSLAVSSLSLRAPEVPSAFSFSVLGGVGVNDARDMQYDSQLGVSLQRGRLQVGLFSRLSVPNQGGIQSAKRGLQNDPACNIDTNNDGSIDASDCDDPSNPGDPTDPCAPDANGVVGPNCPAVTDCAVDNNGDNIIDDSDCKSTTPNNASSYSLSVGADVAVPFVVGPFSVTPGLSLSAAHRAEDSLSLRGGVSLTTSTKVHENLSLDLRLSLDSTRSGATFLSTGLGLHWQRK